MNTRIVLAAVAALSAANVFACTGFVAGKRATATGRVISSHYEDMPYEVRARHPPKGHGGAEPICRYNTLESMVFEFGETPSEGVFHVATGQPCKTPYVSFHPFGGDLPPFVAIGEEALSRVGDHFRQ